MGKSGPRREHSQEQFEALVLDAAEGFARQDGLPGIGMRRIAAAVGYAPNSIYNTLGGLDEIILRLNARTLARLHGHLQSLLAEKRSLRARILRLADGYLDFAASDPHLWSLLFEYRTPGGADQPDWFTQNLRLAVGLMEESLSPLVADVADRRRAVVTLWAGLQGLASMSTSGRLQAMSGDDPRRLARVLIGGFLDGLTAGRTERRNLG